jgi:hypothetical protein
MKFQFNGWVTAEPATNFYAGDTNIKDGVMFRVNGFESPDAVGTCVVTVELPDNFDPREGWVAKLRKEREQAAADFQVRIAEIDRQISQLTAISMG